MHVTDSLAIGGVIGAVISAAKGASWLSDQLDSTKAAASAGGKARQSRRPRPGCRSSRRLSRHKLPGRACLPVRCFATTANVLASTQHVTGYDTAARTRLASRHMAISASIAASHRSRTRGAASDAAAHQLVASQARCGARMLSAAAGSRPTPMPHTSVDRQHDQHALERPAEATGCPLRGKTTNHRTRLAITPSIRPESQAGSANFGSDQPIGGAPEAAPEAEVRVSPALPRAEWLPSGRAAASVRRGDRVAQAPWWKIRTAITPATKPRTARLDGSIERMGSSLSPLSLPRSMRKRPESCQIPCLGVPWGSRPIAIDCAAVARRSTVGPCERLS